MYILVAHVVLFVQDAILFAQGIDKRSYECSAKWKYFRGFKPNTVTGKGHRPYETWSSISSQYHPSTDHHPARVGGRNPEEDG